MASELYSRDILRLAASLIHGDRLADADGTAEVRSPICGSRMEADVAIAPDGRLAAFAVRANACALGQASAAVLRANADGKSLADIEDIRTRVAQALVGDGAMPDDWEQLAALASARDFPARHAAILLPYDALLAAIQNARSSVNG